jgi:hypothetical protein
MHERAERLQPRRRSVGGRDRDGLSLAFVVSGSMQHILVEVDAHDPLIFGAVAATLALVGLIAWLIPAARATLIDPLVAMRTE